MNYGERQERAETIVRAFRSQGQKVFPWKDQMYTGEEIALEVEDMTDLGQALVAAAGLVFHALASTPEFFK